MDKAHLAHAFISTLSIQAQLRTRWGRVTFIHILTDNSSIHLNSRHSFRVTGTKDMSNSQLHSSVHFKKSLDRSKSFMATKTATTKRVYSTKNRLFVCQSSIFYKPLVFKWTNRDILHSEEDKDYHGTVVTQICTSRQ